MIQVEILRWFTSIQTNELNKVAQIFTFMGNKEFYFFFLPMFYWCINKKLGFRLFYVLTCSKWINGLVKVLVATRRPVGVEGVNSLFVESADGGSHYPFDSFPSGHAQGSTTLWGYFALLMRKKWIWTVSIILIFFISIFRLYTGMHWPLDIIAGVAFGILMITVATVVDPIVTRAKRSTQWLLAMAVPIVMFILFQEKVGAVYSGLLFGLGVGYLLEQTFVRMKISKRKMNRVIAYAIGFVGIVTLLALFKNWPDQIFFTFLKYSFFGLWVLFVLPALFVFLKIYRREGEGQK